MQKRPSSLSEVAGLHSRRRRRSSALAISETELKLLSALAIVGLKFEGSAQESNPRWTNHYTV